jgi:hypothetical protein
MPPIGVPGRGQREELADLQGESGVRLLERARDQNRECTRARAVLPLGDLLVSVPFVGLGLAGRGLPEVPLELVMERRQEDGRGDPGRL